MSYTFLLIVLASCGGSDFIFAPLWKVIQNQNPLLATDARDWLVSQPATSESY